MNNLVLTLTPLFISMGVPSDTIDAVYEKFIEVNAQEVLPEKPSVLIAQVKRVIDSL